MHVIRCCIIAVYSYLLSHTYLRQCGGGWRVLGLKLSKTFLNSYSSLWISLQNWCSLKDSRGEHWQWIAHWHSAQSILYMSSNTTSCDLHKHSGTHKKSRKIATKCDIMSNYHNTLDSTKYSGTHKESRKIATKCDIMSNHHNTLDSNKWPSKTTSLAQLDEWHLLRCSQETMYGRWVCM